MLCHWIKKSSVLVSMLVLAGVSGGASAATKDANGDGKSDFLIRWTGFPGTFSIAYMNGPGNSTVTPLTGLPVVDGYNVVNTGDYDGDGFVDVIMRDAANYNYIYLLANGAVKASGTANIPPLPINTIEGRRDLDGDGKTDLLMVNQLGGVMVCYMNGVDVKAPCSNLTGFPSALTTTVETTGVYTPGAKVQMLAKKLNWSTFKFERWLYTLNLATNTVSGVRFNALEAVANMQWVPQGSFDYDGDGLSEIIMRNNLNGNWMAVKVNGTTVVKTTQLFNNIQHANPAIKPYSLFADLRGDGKHQLVLKHNSLNTYIYYEFDGNSVVGSGPVNLPTIPTSNTVVGVLSQ